MDKHGLLSLSNKYCLVSKIMVTNILQPLKIWLKFTAIGTITVSLVFQPFTSGTTVDVWQIWIPGLHSMGEVETSNDQSELRFLGIWLLISHSRSICPWLQNVRLLSKTVLNLQSNGIFSKSSVNFILVSSLFCRKAAMLTCSSLSSIVLIDWARFCCSLPVLSMALSTSLICNE